jgi:glycosyltransferase involved in cell wall biosynthesis
MDVTVILCTYNRCETLARALESVAASTVPSSVEWEVLVVDNNSTDRTHEAVKAFLRSHPKRFRYLFEARQGKSHALNTAVKEARGDVLAFMDDDVTVDPAWLQNLTSSLHDGTWAGAGGRILPAQNISPPRWLALDGPYSMGGMLYAHFDLGDMPQQLDRAPYGTNMAFRKEMFEKHGGFRTDLGPGASREFPHFNEDTEFGRRLIAAGGRLRYEPSAVVYHLVFQDRIRKEYLLTSWFDYGRSVVRETGRRPDVLGLPRYYFSIPNKIAYTLRLSLQWLLAPNPRRRFFLKALVWYSSGKIVEIYRQSRSRTICTHPTQM